MRILILAPNGGVSLSTGGGTNFVLKQARSLARAGHEVVLAGFHALDRDSLERMHRVDLGGVRSRIRVLSAGGADAYRAHRGLPGKPSPYLALLDPRVRAWLGGLPDRCSPDLLWFHDDVPAALARALDSRPSRLYVHYPLLGRSARIAPPLRGSRGTAETAQDAVLRRLAGRLVVVDAGRRVGRIAANSTVTAAVCRRVWGVSAAVVPTYVPRPEPSGPDRGRTAISIGAFHRGKGHAMILEAFEAGAPGDAELTLLGHARDPSLLRALRARAARAPAGRLRIEVDAPAGAVRAALSASRVVVGGAAFEPFGLAILEGMAAGATPIVRRSAFSGAWTDLAEEGRVGPGFDDGATLAGLFRERLGPASAPADAGALRAASAFSEERFDAGITEQLRV